MSLYPLMLHGARIRALVVGGGAVATRRARGLLEAGGAVRVVAPRISQELERLAAEEARLTIAVRPFDGSDLDGATLVVAATDDRGVNERVGRMAQEAGILANVVDAPEEGSFVAAAAHRAGPLLVAVAAGGVPSAAARVRDLIAGRIDGRYGEAVELLAGLRGRLLARGDAAGWRRAVAELLGDDFAESVETGRLAERVGRWA